MRQIEARLAEALDKRKGDGNLRKLTTNRAKTDFFSNDYLGLSQNKELLTQIEECCLNTKLNSGSTGSRLLSGNSVLFEQLEAKLAKLFNGASALLFNSGYSANLAIFSSIPQKGDTIIYDELIHACIKEGSRLSFADRFSFRHNNLEDLEQKLQKAKGEKFVAVESVYSMDGDFAPLSAITDLCKRYDAHLVVDEAHSTGVFGDCGKGLTCNLNLEKEVFARIYTFGKAIGSHGACVVASPLVNEYLVNFARSFIYTTALPPHNLVTLDCTFDYLAGHMELQELLHAKINYFKKESLEAQQENPSLKFIDSNSAIQVVMAHGSENAKRMASHLVFHGFDVRPILSPTVQEGKERIRICLHVYNTEEEITSLIHHIKTFKFEH